MVVPVLRDGDEEAVNNKDKADKSVIAFQASHSSKNLSKRHERM